ncbi:hypothetical protein HZS_3579 [Henneguya salminicola]|nr:hypothetical protein HZS_3579 [Henneguya salminicola]
MAITRQAHAIYTILTKALHAGLARLNILGFNTTKILKMNPKNIIDARRAAHINVWRELSSRAKRSLKKAHIPAKKSHKFKENRNTHTISRTIY